MRLLGRSKQQTPTGVVGLDIGTSGIKLVELRAEGGKPRLVTYGYALDPQLAAGDPLVDPARTAGIVRALRQKSGSVAVQAVAAIPSSLAFHAIVALPVLPSIAPEELQAAVALQARKLFSTPPEELVLDATVLTDVAPSLAQEDAPQGKTTNVLVVGAPKKLVSGFVEFAKECGLELLAVETDVAAMIRAVIGGEKTTVLLVDIGAARSTIVVVDRGIPLVVRSIGAGGAAVTSALASAMHIGVEEAETMKRDLPIAREGGAFPPPLEEAMQPVLHEIRYTAQMVREGRGLQIEKILVTGGGAALPGLRERITAEMNCNVYVGDPWARVAAPAEARGVLEEVGSRLTVAIGLALRKGAGPSGI